VVKFECSCGFKKAVDDKYAGKNVRCPKCNQPVTVSTQQIQAPPNNSIKAYCFLCNKKISVPPQYAGKKVKCPLCKTPLDVPASSTTAPVPLVSQPVPAPAPQMQMPEPISKPIDDVTGLADMERSAKSVELPPELRIPQNYDQPEAPAVHPQRANRLGSLGMSSTLVTIIGFVAGAIVWAIIFAVINSGKDAVKAPKDFQVSPAKINEANEFAKKSLAALQKGDVNEVYTSLTPELQQENNKVFLKAFSFNDPNWQQNFTGKTVYAKNKPEGNIYWFLYASDKKNISMVVRDANNSKVIEGIMMNTGRNTGASPLNLQSELCLNLYLDIGKTYGLPILKVIGKIMGIIAVLGIIVIISGGVVFHKAGEPAWAVIVPFYNLWILARIGNKPPYLGLAILLLSMIPVVGNFASCIALIVISIGVAKAFNRNFIFGIGLWLMPFVFYPILAFSKD
jgi:hypothetical protein